MNTAASSVPLKHEPRWEGAAAAKRREPGELGPICPLLLGGSGPPPQQQRSAAGGVRPPPLAAGMTLDVQGGSLDTEQCAAAPLRAERSSGEPTAALLPTLGWFF